MKITRACDYAIRALAHMAQKPVGTTFMRSELSKNCGIPDSFLGKILQNLAKSDILVSERGKKGGFKLKNDAKSISVYDIITAIEGDLHINECIYDEDFCEYSNECNAHRMWTKIQSDFVANLRNYTVADLTS